MEGSALSEARVISTGNAKRFDTMRTDLSAISDAGLLEAAQSGKPGAFDALVHRHFGVVYAIGLARLNDCGQAEDLAQEVFLRLYLLLDQMRGSLVSHWLARVARNLAVDWQRRDERAARLVPMIPIQDIPGDTADAKAINAREQAVAAEQLAALRAVMAEMGPDQRELVLLHFMEGLSQHDIAQRLGVNRSTVSRQIAQALKSTRSLMENKLKQLAMGLRARPAAEQRTVAVCAAALVLSSEARHATAMVAGKSLGAGGAKFTMSHGSVPAVRALISAIKTGGVTMASTKTVIAVGAALALAAGGYYYYEQEHENSTPAVSGAAEMERQKQIDDQRHRADDERRRADDLRRQAEDERRKKDELRRQEEQRARSTPTKP